MTTYRIQNGDCRAELQSLAACSVDSIVTDPPYELGFMGKVWDRSGIAYQVEVWRECLRVVKPGGHLLAFGGSRTYHRLACAIEDAGFEIRDQIQWLYGSGFPKSLDVSKAIDSAAGAEREVIARKTRPDGTQRTTAGGRLSTPFVAHAVEGDGFDTAPASDAAKQWNGWGTALKPAHEPIVLARKPLIGTVAENVLAHRTGGLNIDGCRIEGEPTHGSGTAFPTNGTMGNFKGEVRLGVPNLSNNLGRWPANVIHDGSEEVLGAFPNVHGAGAQRSGGEAEQEGEGGIFGVGNHNGNGMRFGDSGSAARFFYCAKASREDRSEGLDALTTSSRSMANMTTRAEREGREHRTESSSRNHHPTVKPTDLMRYLCRLVTPPNGTVLDPFCGSGSTGRGAILEGLNFIGIEIDTEYCELAEKRIEAVTKQGAFCFTECAEGLASGL